jgi:hypothetical protein
MSIMPDLIATVSDGEVVNLEFEPARAFGEDPEPLPEGQYRFSGSTINWHYFVTESDRLGIPAKVVFLKATKPTLVSGREMPALDISLGSECTCRLYCYDEFRRG